MSGSNTLTPAQERLASFTRGLPLSPETNRVMSLFGKKVRKLMRKMLPTDTEFQDKMRVYLLKTHGDDTFYDNRLHFFTDDCYLMFVDLMRQCSCCGQMFTGDCGQTFMGDGIHRKLLSCAACKSSYYCDRACQKRDWKQGHKSQCRPANGKQGIEVVLNTCVRALTIMRFFTEVQDEEGNSHKCMSENVLSSILLPKTDPRSKTYTDLANDEWATGGISDRVCDHFRDKQESNRILYPIWETAVNNLAFVPISLDFLSNGLGVPDALVESFEKKMSTNDNTYFVLVMGMVDGNLAVVGGNSFIVTPGKTESVHTPQTSCQEGVGAKSSAPDI